MKIFPFLLIAALLLIVWIFVVKHLTDHYDPLSCASFPAK